MRMSKCTRAAGQPMPLSVLILVLLSFSLGACAGGSQQGSSGGSSSEVNIDQLLGIEPPSRETSQPAAPASEASKPAQKDDDEVMRLLGISPQEKDTMASEQPAVPATSAPAVSRSEGSRQPSNVGEANDVEELRSQIAKLESELAARDDKISELRSELQAKDRQPSSSDPTSLTRQMSTAATLGYGTTQQPSAPASRAAVSAPSGSYQEALALYNARRYQEAIDKFTALLVSGNVDNSLADNCQYWIGESYYGLRNYTQAIAEFEKVFRYPNTNKGDAALLKLGLCYMRLNDKNAARSQFELLLANYPQSQYVSLARRYMDNL